MGTGISNMQLEGDLDIHNEMHDEIENLENAINEYQDNPRKDGGAQMASLYFNSQTKASFMRHQSVYDPDRKSILMNYNLEDFKNSIWENFLGS